jgi:hypothetical protein
MSRAGRAGPDSAPGALATTIRLEERRPLWIGETSRSWRSSTLILVDVAGRRLVLSLLMLGAGTAAELILERAPARALTDCPGLREDLQRIVADLPAQDRSG